MLQFQQYDKESWIHSFAETKIKLLRDLGRLKTRLELEYPSPAFNRRLR